MNGERKQTQSAVAVAIVLAIAVPQAVHAQRAPGGPAAPSLYDAFYTLGPDSLPRDGVPKGAAHGDNIIREPFTAVRGHLRAADFASRYSGDSARGIHVIVLARDRRTPCRPKALTSPFHYC
jgi:hypothetical protein